jgi:hypothetical protein
VLPQFSADAIAREVLSRLERQRGALAGDAPGTEAEVRTGLAEARARYAEEGLPAPYFEALARELASGIGPRWRGVAAPYSELEGRGFGIWRGGDLLARLAFVFAGLALGGLCVALPFIPIWEKWFPFALAVGGYFLPDAQARWQRHRYARQLGEIVRDFGALQPQLEAAVKLTDLLAEPQPGQDGSKEAKGSKR